MNLGIGIPEIIGSVAAEEGFGPSLTLAADSGIIGGIPLSGLDMGAAVNAEAELKMADMFDICHGGGLDLCALGLAEIDAMGNVNVSKFHGRVTGPGASSTWPSTRRNSSSWGPLQPAVCENTVKAGGWSSTGKGSTRNSRRISNRSPFPGLRRSPRPARPGRYRTGRLPPDAAGTHADRNRPGVDLEQDILSQMEFRPLIADDLQLMDGRIFQPNPMGLS